MAYLFISYSHEDLPTLKSDLAWLAQQGVEVWYDDSITPGGEWSEEIAQRIAKADAVLFFASKSAAGSRYCRDEIAYAVQADKDVITVYVEDVELTEGLKLQLLRSQAIMRFKYQREAYLQQLLTAIHNRSENFVHRAVAVSPGNRPFLVALGVAFILLIGIISFISTLLNGSPKQAIVERNVEAPAPAEGILARTRSPLSAFIEAAEKAPVLGEEKAGEWLDTLTALDDGASTDSVEIHRAWLALARIWPADVSAEPSAAMEKLGYWRQVDDATRQIETTSQSDHFFERGYAYQMLGLYERAIDDYSSALENSPNHGFVYSFRSAVYEISGDSRRALQDIDAALDLTDDDPLLLVRKGKLHGDLGENLLALSTFRHAKDLLDAADKDDVALMEEIEVSIAILRGLEDP